MLLNEFFNRIELNELREILDRNYYGSWIHPDGTVDDVSSHELWLENHYGNVDHNKRYGRAFDEGFVRVIHPRSTSGGTLNLTGNFEYIKKNFKVWWPTAYNSNAVFIENENWLTSHNYYLPKDKNQLMQDWRPTSKRKTSETLQLDEVREYLDPDIYGGWVNPFRKRVENVGSHESWLRDEYGSDDAYAEAYADGWVRTVNGRFSFMIQGNLESIRAAFRYWWPSAIQSDLVYVENEKDRPFIDYRSNYDIPQERNLLRQHFGPQPRNEEARLNEIREYFDRSYYGAWMSEKGKIIHVDSHSSWLSRNYDSIYDAAFDDGWVRVILSSELTLEGNRGPLEKTFKYWWPTAISSSRVVINVADLNKNYWYEIPKNKVDLRREFGPLDKVKEASGSGIELPDDVIKAFTKLGNLQRGEPEHAMLRVQHIMGGGVLNPTVEHVGDLTHRMSHLAKYGSFGYDMFADKVVKTLKWLTSPYGFEREYKENVQNNAKYRNQSPDELQKKINIALKNYADEHSKLPVYNKLQWVARQAAIELGNQKFSNAASHLEYLQYVIKDVNRYNEEAARVYRSANGDLMQYKPGMTEKIDEVAKWDLGGYWITDDGDILEVDHGKGLHHVDIAFNTFAEYIDLSDFESPSDARDDESVRGEVLDLAYDDGWIQVSTSTKELGIFFHPNKVEKRNIKKLMNLVRRDRDYDRYVFSVGMFINEYFTKRQAVQRLGEFLT